MTDVDTSSTDRKDEDHRPLKRAKCDDVKGEVENENIKQKNVSDKEGSDESSAKLEETKIPDPTTEETRWNAKKKENELTWEALNRREKLCAKALDKIKIEVSAAEMLKYLKDAIAPYAEALCDLHYDGKPKRAHSPANDVMDLFDLGKCKSCEGLCQGNSCQECEGCFCDWCFGCDPENKRRCWDCRTNWTKCSICKDVYQQKEGDHDWCTCGTSGCQGHKRCCPFAPRPPPSPPSPISPEEEDEKEDEKEIRQEDQ